LVAEPTPLIDYYFGWAMREYDLSSLTGRQHAARDLAPVVAELRDPTVRANYLRRLASETGTTPESIYELTRRRRARPGPRARGPAAQPTADRVEEGLLEYALQAPPEHLDLVARLDPACLSDPMLRHLLNGVVRMIRDRGELDLDTILNQLDAESQARLTAIRERAATGPPPSPFASALQGAALRLRERRIRAEVQDADTVSSAGDAVASSQEFGQRINRLVEQLQVVDRAKRELSVLTGDRPG
jgi:DNA primase